MIQTNLKAPKGKIILHWEKEENVSASGIVLSTNPKRGDFATIVSVNSSTDLEVGMKVIFDKLAGQFVKDDFDNELLIVKEEAVWGIVEE